MDGPEESLAMAVAVISAAGWLLYFRWKDRARPEPPLLMAAGIAGGAAGVLLAVLGYAFASAAGAETTWEILQSSVPEAMGAALRVGAVEETSKLLAVLPIALFATAFDELLDGIVYAACSALGFATAETWWMLAHGDWELMTALGRAVTGPITHALLAIPWGLGLSVAMLRKRWWALPAGLVVSAAAHGAYDLLLARPNLPPLVSSGVVLVLWLWLLWYAPRLARLHPVVRAPPQRPV